jgi:hypothetical protein
VGGRCRECERRVGVGRVAGTRKHRGARGRSGPDRRRIHYTCALSGDRDSRRGGFAEGRDRGDLCARGRAPQAARFQTDAGPRRTGRQARRSPGCSVAAPHSGSMFTTRAGSLERVIHVPSSLGRREHPPPERRSPQRAACRRPTRRDKYGGTQVHRYADHHARLRDQRRPSLLVASRARTRPRPDRSGPACTYGSARQGCVRRNLRGTIAELM